MLISGNTRGRGKGIIIELEGASASTEVMVHFDEMMVNARQILPVAPERLKEENVAVSLSRLSQGPLVHEMNSQGNIDRLEVQLISGEGSFDQAFSYTDMTQIQPGDYYYIRVRQIDGSMAWSSPFWMGASESAR